MINERFHVVYEFENKSPSWKTYDSEEDYRRTSQDRKGVIRFHEGLAEQIAKDLFLRLDHEFGVRTGRKELRDSVE